MRIEHSELGLCPKCDAPVAEYHYTLEGPLNGGTVSVTVSIRCPVCGYSSEKKILFPVKALYLIRYMLAPPLRPKVEKLYIIAAGEAGKE